MILSPNSTLMYSILASPATPAIYSGAYSTCDADERASQSTTQPTTFSLVGEIASVPQMRLLAPLLLVPHDHLIPVLEKLRVSFEESRRISR